MNHYDLTLMLADWADLEVETVDEAVLERARESLAALVEIETRQVPEAVSTGGEGRMGLGFMRFKEQRFYSLKLGNLARDRLGAAGLGGALLSSGAGIGALIAAGTLTGWAGAAALVAIGLALIGRAKPFVTAFGLDEATTLDMAWRLSAENNGFRLVSVDALAAAIGDVETIYGNAGFTKAKLTNALNKLEAIGMIKEAGKSRYQLIEKIRVSGTDQLAIAKA
jgi:hypothetical protein